MHGLNNCINVPDAMSFPLSYMAVDLVSDQDYESS